MSVCSCRFLHALRPYFPGEPPPFERTIRPRRTGPPPLFPSARSAAGCGWRPPAHGRGPSRLQPLPGLANRQHQQALPVDAKHLAGHRQRRIPARRCTGRNPPGQSCRICIGFDLVITGWIDRRSILIDAQPPGHHQRARDHAQPGGLLRRPGQRPRPARRHDQRREHARRGSERINGWLCPPLKRGHFYFGLTPTRRNALPNHRERRPLRRSPSLTRTGRSSSIAQRWLSPVMPIRDRPNINSARHRR